MTEIRFYHMERSTLEQTLPALLSKALERGHKIIVKTADRGNAEALNGYLWTYDPNSFLPHGTEKDGHADRQPIWITDKDENPNEANTLILTQATSHDSLEEFDLCCEMLNGNNPDEVSAARQRWKTYKDKGLDVTYWQQGQSGWEKKAG